MQGFGWALTFAFWPFLGWLGDLPRNVGQRESPIAVVGQWTSTLFHVCGALIATIAHPTWGLTWALFAGVVLARRLAASGSTPVPLRLGEIARCIGTGIPEGRWIFAFAVAAPAVSAFYTPGGFLGDAQGILALLGPVVVIGMLGHAGVAHRAHLLDYLAARELWTARLATILGVAPSVMEQSQIVIHPGGLGVRFTVPPAAAPKLTPDRRDALDALIASVAPEFMLDPMIDHLNGALIPVDAETAQRRSAVAASGGLVTGVDDAPVDAPTGDDDAVLVITEEDLR